MTAAQSIVPPSEDAKIDRPLKVLLLCSGVGIANRGVETLFRETFDGLHGTPGMDVKLLKGAGPNSPDDYRIWCLRRDRFPAKILGRIVNRDPYIIEQLSSLLPIVRQIRKAHADIVFSSECNLMMRLFKYRNWFGVPYRIILSNGLPLSPPFTNVDHVQQTAPFYYDQAMAAGEPPQRHSLVPLGFVVPPGDPMSDPSEKIQLRKRLSLPVDRKIVLCVGWISRELKRTDYTIDELSRMPTPRPFLMLLGAMGPESAELIEQARQKLGAENFAAREVVPTEVPDYYRAADVFTLGSIREGFGRVYVEALIHGLPALANDHPVMRYVMGDEGTFADMSKPGGMAQALTRMLEIPNDPATMARRRQDIRRRLSWSVLAPTYLEMFRAAVRYPLYSSGT